ncbi:winged helix-turn-helix transcriptional regulator [Xylanibacter muris]|uniref:Helix-turn-helix transcriptional regulator n=1 Tax=Xylanibacter muris TaxID=2736290 RepID=A0ABX2AQW6_9BACT|nr:helix-turn-helix domain-containing protein [Xylanibacter muris]NPD92637.1 helix-turn-helix transcriptional regulator [Xylanibacter muris]
MEDNKHTAIKNTMFPNCPIRNILAMVGDKWSLLIMNELQQHPSPMRFSALRKAIPDISQKVLTTTLRNLEANGFINRKVYPEIPPRTEYSLTPRALSFMEACQPMIQWAMENFSTIIKERAAAPL